MNLICTSERDQPYSKSNTLLLHDDDDDDDDDDDVHVTLSSASSATVADAALCTVCYSYYTFNRLVKFSSCSLSSFSPCSQILVMSCFM